MATEDQLPNPLRPLWLDESRGVIQVIDQRQLPHEVVVADLRSVADVIAAIDEMYVRGAPLIGVTAAYGVYLAACRATQAEDPAIYLAKACGRIKAARPTAVNLIWAVDLVAARIQAVTDPTLWPQVARRAAERIAEREIDHCKAIGEHGVALIEAVSGDRNGAPVNILTHCNAGWLATMAYGTATAPIYAAHERGIALHVWVDETRPLNQGARLTAWELGRQGIPHTVITDNCGGHLMQHGMVDMVLVGTDRTTASGDVANKIGTYLKALAAQDNDIPFYVALPSSTFDWQTQDGLGEIPIEERDPGEVHCVQGWDAGGAGEVRITPAESPAANYAFDVTPARLVTEFITERGRCPATVKGIKDLFPEKF